MTARRPFRQSVWPAVLLATIVLLARGGWIAAHQSERYDDEYHLNRGVAFLRGDTGGRKLNDPPLGEAIGALPLILTGSYNADRAIDMGLYGHRLSPERLLVLVGLWKSLLLVPMVAVAFCWARALYGTTSAWLATLLVLIEPTIAAHAPLPSVDAIGAEGIVVACFATWHYLRGPSVGRAMLAAASVALAMLLKNTALILPAIAALTVAAWWLRDLLADRATSPADSDRPNAGAERSAAPAFGRSNALGETIESRRPSAPSWRRRAIHVAVAAILLPLCIWTLTGFDVSRPLRKVEVPPGTGPRLAALLKRELPAGVYVRAVAIGLQHVESGHAAFLDGDKYWGGRWDYFPTVATYKLPVGLGAALAVGVASLAWRRPRFDEWSLALPTGVYLATLLRADINIGFRHFLPVLIPALILASRAVGDGARLAPRAIVAFACCALALVETYRFHPNYLSFTNALRPRPWLKISDSNLDWGQSLPALRRWADARADGRPIRFAYFGWETPDAARHYLGGSRVQLVLRPPYVERQPAPLPTDGLFVVSPVALAGVYDKRDRLRPLRALRPIERVDGCLLVYDLDRATPPIVWPHVPRPKAKPAPPPLKPTKAAKRRAAR